LQQQAQRLDDLEARRARAWDLTSSRQQARLDTLQGRLAQCSPQQRLQWLANQAAQLAQRLEYCINTQLSYRREKLAIMSRALDTISPLATLQRGYSITLQQTDGSVVHSVEQVRSGDTLETRLARGCIISKVTGTDAS
jgi:exodeoxyribonuclease VII large subunit